MIVLVDASGYIYRAFYSQPPMVRSDGAPTGAIHGYCRMLWNVKKNNVTASHFAVVFDKGKSATRTALYPGYKAQRPPIHPDLAAQLDLLRDATRAFGFPVVESQGVEADDLIASYAEAAADRYDDCLIVSSDKDLMQLVREGISMYDPLKDRLIGRDEVIEKFGVPPELVVDAQALIGDATDNVPGVSGIGVKTAAKLLTDFGSLDELLMRAGEITQKKVRDSLLFERQQALVSRKLVRLMRDVALPVSIKDLEARDVDASGVLKFARAMEFTSFAADIEAFYGVTA